MSILVAAITLFEGGRGLWRRRVGRRFDRYARLRRLGAGAQLGFFESVLGEPPAMRRTVDFDLEQWDERLQQLVPVTETYTESFFIEPDHYVQAVTDADNTVVAFSVTARAPSFRPTFTAPLPLSLRSNLRNWRLYRVWPRPLLKVKLNRTRFVDADRPVRKEHGEEEGWAVRSRAQVAARSWSYSEAHDFGNPGLYQTFVLTASIAGGRQADFDALHEIADASEQFDDGARAMTEAGRRFRRSTPITTYTVLGAHAFLDNYARQLGFGPHGDEVRTLP